jgi:hypothetical protein
MNKFKAGDKVIPVNNHTMQPQQFWNGTIPIIFKR